MCHQYKVLLTVPGIDEITAYRLRIDGICMFISYRFRLFRHRTNFDLRIDGISQWSIWRWEGGHRYWYDCPHETNLYRYTRTSGNAPAVTNQVTPQKRRKRVTQSEIKWLRVIVLAEPKGTSWESEYGSQIYPVIMLGGEKVRYTFEQPEGQVHRQISSLMLCWGSGEIGNSAFECLHHI